MTSMRMTARVDIEITCQNNGNVWNNNETHSLYDRNNVFQENIMF